MKYTPTYFNFDGLEFKQEILEIFLTVAVVYILIFTTAWVYNRLDR
jgi:hypothetical protein